MDDDARRRRVAEIIDALGGPRTIAQAITEADTEGRLFSPNSVHWWKYRKTIPQGQWDTLLALAARLGVADAVTLADLRQLHRPRLRRGARSGPDAPMSVRRAKAAAAA